jgi:hypothetical protein
MNIESLDDDIIMEAALSREDLLYGFAHNLTALTKTRICSLLCNQNIVFLQEKSVASS